MIKPQAIATATALGLAVYRTDTVHTLTGRIEQHHAARAEIADADARVGAMFRRLAVRRSYRHPWTQFRLPIPLPRDFSVACGILA